MSDETLAVTPDMVSQFMQLLKNNEGLEYRKTPDSTAISLFKFDLKRLVALENANKVHFVGWLNRPGTSLFCNILEYRYYKPDSERNDLFEYRMFKWNDLIWCIATIPADEIKNGYLSAEEANLKLTQGVPCVLGGNDGNVFPLTANVFSLSNNSDSAVYKGLGGDKDAHAEEAYKIKKLFEEYNRENLINWEATTDEILAFQQRLAQIPNRGIFEEGGNEYAVDHKARYVFLTKGEANESHFKLIILCEQINWHMLDATKHPPTFA